MMRKRLNISKHDSIESSVTLKYVVNPSSAPSGSLELEESTAGTSITEQNGVKILNRNTQQPNRRCDDQLQDDINEKEVSKGHHELLMSVIGSIDELKGDISTLQHSNTRLEKSVKSYRNDMIQLKMENNAMKMEITKLNNVIHWQKFKTLKSEEDILYLRSIVAAHKVQARMTEACYYMRKLFSFMARHRRNISRIVRHNCEEFSDYLKACIVKLGNLKDTYQRLHNNLRQGLIINMSEFDQHLPTLPKLCDEVSQDYERRFETNNRFEVPSHWFFEAPPPYSRYPVNNEDPHNSDQVPSQRETDILHRSENEITLTSEFQAPFSGASFVSGTELQIPLNRQSLNPTYCQAPFFGSEPQGASGNEHQVSTGSEFAAFSLSEHYAYPGNEYHASSWREFHPSSGREYHPSSDSELYNSARSELPSTTRPLISQGFEMSQIPPSSIQFHHNDLHQVPQITMSTPLAGMMPALQYTQQVLRPQTNVQHPQQHSRMMTDQVHDTLDLPVYAQPLSHYSNSSL